MTGRGRFIVVEGLEGAGKSTAINMIKRYLEQLSISLVTTREPGGTRLGEQIRKLIKEKVEGEVLDPRSELLLLYAARVQLIEEVIRPSLEKGFWVLADRFELSTFAYQGGGRELGMEMISLISDACLQQFKPDLILFLDVNPDVGLLRAKGRGEADRIEQESIEFFKKVQRGYHQMVQKMDNVVTVDANKPQSQVQESILQNLKDFTARYAIV